MALLVLQPDAAAGKDSWVYSGSPTVNHGTSDRIHSGEDGAGSEWRGYIEFNINPPILPGSIITMATLALQCWFQFGSPTIQIRECTSAWVESTITWNTKPSQGASFASQVISSIGLKTWTITALVQKWVDVSNNGLVVMFTGFINDAIFRSSDYVTAGLRPKLTVNYTLPPASTDGDLMTVGVG